jgi:zinc-finger binding domain of transposase IS66/Transposase C of IS166 homeodomain
MEIDPHYLPAEVNLLQQIVLQLLQAVEDKDQLVVRLQHQLAQLLRYRYGQKRERIDENQLFLYAAQLIAAGLQADSNPSSEEPAANSPPGSDQKEKTTKPERCGHGRKPLPKSLERRRVVFDLEESQRQCQHCHTPMQKIGEDIGERLEFIPASLQVIEEVRPKYACAKGCGVLAAPKPAAPIEKGLSGQRYWINSCFVFSGRSPHAAISCLRIWEAVTPSSNSDNSASACTVRPVAFVSCRGKRQRQLNDLALSKRAPPIRNGDRHFSISGR